MSGAPRRDLHGMMATVAFIAGGVAALYYSRDFTALGSVFPRTIGSAMVLFAIAYIVWAWLKPGPVAVLEKGSMPRRVLLAATMLAWSLLLNVLGFLSSSALAFAALLLISNYDRWTLRMAMVYLLVGAVVLGGIYATFRFGLKVPLPTGLLI